MRAAPLFNAPVAAVASSPRFGRLLNSNIAMISYTGGRFSFPVAYRRTGEAVIIGVNMPEAKTWWRNFLGNGGTLTLRLDGTEHTGHAVAKRDEHGRVVVTVRLTD